MYVDKIGFQSLLSLRPSPLIITAAMVVNSTIRITHTPGKFLKGQLLAFLSWQSSPYWMKHFDFYKDWISFSITLKQQQQDARFLFTNGEIFIFHSSVHSTITINANYVPSNVLGTMNAVNNTSMAFAFRLSVIETSLEFEAGKISANRF